MPKDGFLIGGETLMGRVALLVAVTSAAAYSSAWGQTAKPTLTAATENRIAVMRSGSWNIDGEYQDAKGKFYKASGYFAYLGSTSTSEDNGDTAVLAIFLQPLSGEGDSYWLGAHLACLEETSPSGVRCRAVNGANQLLDLNYTMTGLPKRGSKQVVQVSLPSDQEQPWNGRSTPRGRFSLAPEG